MKRIHGETPRHPIPDDCVPDCPLPTSFKVGDKVTFTNDCGIKFKGHRVAGFTKTNWLHDRVIYLCSSKYKGWWMPHHENELTKES